jgi:hypothetical protein
VSSPFIVHSLTPGSISTIGEFYISTFFFCMPSDFDEDFLEASKILEAAYMSSVV